MHKLLVFTTVIVILMWCAPASADVSCPPTCTVQLQESNVSQLAGVVVTVTIDNSGTHTILSFQLTHNPLTNSAIGIDQIGWTGGPLSGGSNAFSSDYNSVGSNWIGHNKNGTTYVAQVTGPDAGSMDGFGKFNVEGAASASTDGVSSPIVLTLANKVTTFYSNSTGNIFSVHLRFGGNCSGFIGGLAGTSSVNNNPDCIPETQVPEPGTVALLGTGLCGLARLLRRKWLG